MGTTKARRPSTSNSIATTRTPFIEAPLQSSGYRFQNCRKRSMRGTRLALRSNFQISLRSHSLNNQICRSRRNHPGKLPSSRRKQLAEFCLCPFAPARKDKHLQIQKLGRRELVPGLNDAVHDQHLPPEIHALAASCQDLDAGIVRPIMENVLHDVRIGSGRDRRKHIPTLHAAAATIYEWFQSSILRSLEHTRHFIECAFQMRVLLQ